MVLDGWSGAKLCVRILSSTYTFPPLFSCSLSHIEGNAKPIVSTSLCRECIDVNNAFTGAHRRSRYYMATIPQHVDMIGSSCFCHLFIGKLSGAHRWGSVHVQLVSHGATFNSFFSIIDAIVLLDTGMAMGKEKRSWLREKKNEEKHWIRRDREMGSICRWFVEKNSSWTVVI